MKKSLIALAILSASGVAFADAVQCHKDATCNITVGSGAPGTGGNGGAGGNGGNGGTGITGGSFGGAGGIGLGVGGSVVSSGNGGHATIATGAVNNTVNAGNNQANNINSNRNSNRNNNTANGGAGGSATVASGAVVVNNTITQPDTSAATREAAAQASADRAADRSAAMAAAATPQVVKYEGLPAQTAYAAPLTSSNGTCMGSTSIGLQGALGASFGTTWTDSGCDARYDAAALREAGRADAAVARLCLKPEIAQAMELAGTPCPSAKAGKNVKTSAATTEDSTTVSYTDPIIRSRLGLPPLN